MSFTPALRFSADSAKSPNWPAHPARMEATIRGPDPSPASQTPRVTPATMLAISPAKAPSTVFRGLMLGASRGVPYVTDGNESFSMLVHASNLYHFPLSQTFIEGTLAAHP